MTKGFTLIEAVVVLGVFAILMLAGTDFLVQIVQNSNRAAIENEVHQNANRIMQEVSDSIRKSSCVSWAVGTPPGYGDVVLTTYSDSCATAVDTYQFVFDPDPTEKLNSGKVFKNGLQLSANGVAAIDCVGGSQCGTSWADCKNGFSVSGNSGANQAVTINLVVQATPSATRSDFCAAIRLSDTLTPRIQY